ncbi:MAG: DUF4446 family protein [Candidatus Nealsonbacteria bacterium]
MFESLKKDKKPENIKELVSYIEKLEQKVDGLEKNLENVKKQSKFSIQKAEIIRYNPFSSAGGNQSFSIVLLDADNNGMVVTSLFTQESNRVYGKPIKNGESEYTLSDEEKEIIKRAIGS